MRRVCDLNKLKCNVILSLLFYVFMSALIVPLCERVKFPPVKKTDIVYVLLYFLDSMLNRSSSTRMILTYIFKTYLAF